jgi:hypothetical protein
LEDSASCSASDTAAFRDSRRPDPGLEGCELGLETMGKPEKGDAPNMGDWAGMKGGGGRTKGWPEGEQGTKSLLGEGLV